MLISVIRPIPQAALDFVRAHEGCKLVASADIAGHMDAGFGHDDPSLRPGQTITQAQADAWLSADLQKAAQRLEDAIGEACVAELTSNQYAALLSFVFNVGIDPKWAICQRLREQNFDAVPSELMRFVNAGGKKIAGLVNRRADEVKLWSTDEPGSVPTDPSSSTTRAIDTPPTAAPVSALSKSKTWLTGLVSAGLAAASAWAPQIKAGADNLNTAIAPYVGQSQVLQSVASHLALVAAGVAASVPVLIWLQHRALKQQ